MPEDNDKGKQTPQIDLNDPAVKKAIEDAVTTQVAGLKTNRDEILAEKRKVSEELEALRKTWGDLNPEKVKGLISQFEKSEEAKLIADGKIEEVLNLRTEAMRQDADTRVAAAGTKVTELEGTIKAKDAVIARLVIDARIDEAARTLECTGPALRDIRRAAREVFGLNEEHAPEARGPDGTLLMGKDGKSPLTPAEWLEHQREASPHWWGPSSGGGASGGIKLPEGGKITEEQLNKMSASEKLQHSMRGK